MLCNGLVHWKSLLQHSSNLDSYCSITSYHHSCPSRLAAWNRSQQFADLLICEVSLHGACCMDGVVPWPHTCIYNPTAP